MSHNSIHNLETVLRRFKNRVQRMNIVQLKRDAMRCMKYNYGMKHNIIHEELKRRGL